MEPEEVEEVKKDEFELTEEELMQKRTILMNLLENNNEFRRNVIIALSVPGGEIILNEFDKKLNKKIRELSRNN